LLGCTEDKKADQGEEQAAAEEAVSEDEGWIVLFDGTSFDGWRGYGMEAILIGIWAKMETDGQDLYTI
jgi:hypothetical protein